MNNAAQKIKAWLLAVAVTYIIATALVSQFNLASVEAFGLEVSAAQHLAAAWHDMTHMTGIYLPVIAIGFLLALPVAGWLGRRLPDARMLLFALAGFAALLAIHALLYAVFGIVPVAATRNLAGLLSQGLAGAVGGAVFYLSLERAGR